MENPVQCIHERYVDVPGSRKSLDQKFRECRHQKCCASPPSDHAVPGRRSEAETKVFMPHVPLVSPPAAEMRFIIRVRVHCAQYQYSSFCHVFMCTDCVVPLNFKVATGQCSLQGGDCETRRETREARQVNYFGQGGATHRPTATARTNER